MQDYKCHWAHKHIVRLPYLFQHDFHIPPRQPANEWASSSPWQHLYTVGLETQVHTAARLWRKTAISGYFSFCACYSFKAQRKHTIHYLLTNQSSGSREQVLHWKFPSCPQTVYLIGKEFALLMMCHAYWRGRFFSQTNIYNIYDTQSNQISVASYRISSNAGLNWNSKMFL